MPSTLVKDALFRVSTQLQDIAPQFVRWNERELITWLNDGQKAIAKYLPASCTRIDTIRLRPGTRQSIELIPVDKIKPGDDSPPAPVFGNYLNSVVRNMGADGVTPGRAIRIVSSEVLDSQNPDWHTSVGTGRVDQFVFDPRAPKNFYVTPAIGTTPTWVEVSYLANPVEIINTGTPTAPLYGADSISTAVISVDDKYIDDLVNYILARAYMKDANFANSQPNAATYSAMFTGSLNAQVQALTGNNPNLAALPFSAQINIPQAAR